MSVGVKETLEILEGLKVLGVAAGKIASDGKVDLKDLGALLDVAKDFEVFVEAVKDGDKVVEEFKDLDAAEITQVVSKVFEIINAFKEAKAQEA